MHDVKQRDGYTTIGAARLSGASREFRNMQGLIDMPRMMLDRIQAATANAKAWP
jgi:hypothetical protein